MIELEQIFAEVGISQHLESFIEHGFDTWDAIQDITESDLDVLGVKLGHRRKLQRRIANSRGLSQDLALASPSQIAPPEDRPPDEQKGSAVKAEGRDAGAISVPQGAKRKYRRHPKPDENAPDRPPSAYVIFSNRTREDLKSRNMSFTEIAKLVGENWQGLSAAEKEPYEQQASAAKERYNLELSAYKKTPLFAEYSQYLTEFKTRQSNQQQVTDLDVPKRPKLETHSSAESSTAASSSVSQYSRDSPPAHMLADPSPGSSSQWPPIGNHHSSGLALPAFYPQNRRGSPSSPSNMLSGYRETGFGGSSQSLPWREGNREQRAMPIQQRRRVASIGDRPAGYSAPHMGESLSPTDAVPHVRRMGLVPHPPSTSASASSPSTSTSAYSTPRSPLEPSLERSRSISSLFTHKSPGGYENRLPPLHVSSLPPQSRAQAPQQPPSNIQTREEYQSSMARIHGQPTRDLRHSGSVDNNDPRPPKFGPADDGNLDPVSALLRAGEIVNLKNRGEPPN